MTTAQADFEKRTKPTRTKFLAPIRLSNILIPNERPYYNHRKHWAYLLPGFFEAIALTLTLFILSGNAPPNAFGGFLALLALITLASLILTSHTSKWMALGVVLSTLVGWQLLRSASILIFTALAIFGRFLYLSSRWAFYERLVITNRRLIGAKGLLRNQVNMMPLIRITDLSYDQTMWAEMLGYGNLRVESAGQDQALGDIKFINDPDFFYTTLLALSTSPTPTEAILSELADAMIPQLSQEAETILKARYEDQQQRRRRSNVKLWLKRQTRLEDTQQLPTLPNFDPPSDNNSI